MKFIRAVPNSSFNIHDTQVVKPLDKLRLGLCRLNNWNFRHDVQYCINPIWNCGHSVDIKNCSLLHYPYYTCTRLTCFNNINHPDSNIMEANEPLMAILLLIRKKKLDCYINKSIIMYTTESMISRKRFNSSLIHWKGHLIIVILSFIFIF